MTPIIFTTVHVKVGLVCVCPCLWAISCLFLNLFFCMCLSLCHEESDCSSVLSDCFLFCKYFSNALFSLCTTTVFTVTPTEIPQRNRAQYRNTICTHTLYTQNYTHSSHSWFFSQVSPDFSISRALSLSPFSFSHSCSNCSLSHSLSFFFSFIFVFPPFPLSNDLKWIHSPFQPGVHNSCTLVISTFSSVDF